MKGVITKVILLLSLVSLCTDLASEMLYPILPVYLESIGFSVFFIGILEGIAEGISGLSKGYFGRLSDVKGVRIPFVWLGYGLSAISKPLLALSTWLLFVLGARTLDRLGKGIRTGARDAILAVESPPEARGKVFGFHRGMDTAGAVFGPLVALAYLYFHPNDYRSLFFIAFLPGLAAILLTFMLKEKRTPPQPQKSASFFSFFHYWKESRRSYRLLLIGLLAFSLVNSSDFFLLLRVKGFSSSQTVIWVYVLYNVVYALSSYPLGMLGDSFGLKRTYLLGMLVFATVYGGMAWIQSVSGAIVLFALYGLYTASTEGISKAWISRICRKEDTATAIGAFAAFNSITTLLASMLAGLGWQLFGPRAIFLASAVGAVLVLIYLLLVRIENKAAQ